MSALPDATVARGVPPARGPAHLGLPARRQEPRSDRLMRVIEAQRDIACTPLEVDLISQAAADAARAVSGAPGALVAELVQDARLVPRVASGSARLGPPEGVPLAGTLAEVALRTGRTQRCDDSATDPRTDPERSRLIDARSSVVVPLLHGERRLGVLLATSPEPHAFDAEDQQLLDLFGSVAAERLAHALTRDAHDRQEGFESAVLAALEEGLIVQDASGAIVMANEAAGRILGVDPAVLVGQSHSNASWVAYTEDGDLLPPEQHLPMVALRTGQAQPARVLGIPGRDGSMRWLKITAVPIIEAGAARGVVCTLGDVTASRAADLALRESEQHFRLAFDNAPIGMTMISLRPETAGTYLRANAAFERMVGYTSHELTGLPLDRITTPEDRDRDRGLFAQILAGRADHLSFEKRYVARDGRVVIAWLTTQVARDAHGEPLYLISHNVDITERKAAEAELERLALTDTLTGLANRTLLGDRLSHALARLDRDGGHIGLLLLDLDRFKLVNDSLGHQVGDDLLVEVARRLETVCRTDNTVARLGGDEFVVLVEGLGSPEHVHAVATRLVEAMREPYLMPTGETLVTTASIGVAVAADSTRLPSDLFREADLALYRAKDFGRDGYALFDDDLRATAVARVGAEQRLRRALEDNLLRLRYQPIVSLSTGRVVGAEALVRLDDPELGLLTPVDFIEVAEETGQIVDVDAVVLEEGVRQLAEWSRLASYGFRRLAVNITARSLELPGFADRLGALLERHGVDGSLLRVELTERSLLASNPQVRASLQAVSALGVGIGLDDFGTGYSALAYLQRFSLNFLKIDRSFVSRLGGGPREDAIVAAIVDLAHAHAMSVIAEGVETAEQLAALRIMGCDRAQGYFFGKPVPADELVALVRSGTRW